MDRWAEAFAPIKMIIEVVEAQVSEPQSDKAAPKGKKGV